MFFPPWGLYNSLILLRVFFFIFSSLGTSAPRLTINTINRD